LFLISYCVEPQRLNISKIFETMADMIEVHA